MPVQSATISAENTFITLSGNERPHAGARVSISVADLTGTGSTVTVQRRLDNANWRDVADGSFTEDTEKSYIADESCDLRLGVKTGGYLAGDIAVRLGFDRPGPK